MEIAKLYNLIDSLRSEYISEAKEKKPIQRWIQDYHKEIQEVKQYRGREILELLQNADDAGSDTVNIILNTKENTLSVINSGSSTQPFSIKGIKSIMCANMSPKGRGMIGAKGLGFRSILNWSEQITIFSDNIKIDFHPDYIEFFWHNQLAQYVDNRTEVESEARHDGRTVPLSLLALPKVSEISHSSFGTTIRMTYHPDNKSCILKDLENFKPYSLLFLHNIKTIKITVDDEELSNCQSRVISIGNNTKIVELAGEKWVVKHQSGISDRNGIEKDYEVACAFNLSDNSNRYYPIYSFFPTGTSFKLPCILHATLELDSSRKSLIVDDPDNHEMIARLADVISDIAEFIKTREISWRPYSLMRPEIPIFETSYEAQLFKLLNQRDGEYIPLIDGLYGNARESYFLSERIFDIVKDSEAGKRIFNNMRIPIPKNYRVPLNGVNKPNQEIVSKIEEFGATLSDPQSQANYIFALVSYSYECGVPFDCHIFKDARGSVITGKTYINEGQTVDYLPSFLNFEYLDDRVAEHLIRIMEIRHGHPEQERSLAAKLSRIGDVSASDINSITRQLLPKSRDMARSENELQELMTVLFRLYLKRRDDFCKSEYSDVWLLTESGIRRGDRAVNLILADKRFPDGFRNLGFSSFDYPPEKCVLFPPYLLEIEGSSAGDIQNFMIALGAQLYFTRERVFYGDDSKYIDSLGLSPEVRRNCSWKDRRYDSKNTANIADPQIMEVLSLNELIELIKVSGYQADVCGTQKIHWFSQTYKTPVNVNTSYASYLLRENTKASCLRYYSVLDREWLPGMKSENIEAFDDNPDTERILYALGAVRRLSDFPAAMLYEAVRVKTNNWKSTGDFSGAKTFYHKIKMALNEKASLVVPKNLELLCRVNGTLTVMPASSVYYSDNAGLKDLRNKLPVLEMNSREGEDIVKKVFGCKLFKELRTSLLNFVPNDSLSSELAGKIDKLKPYILAIVSKNAGSKGGDSDKLVKDFVAILEKFTIPVMANASYCYASEHQDLGNCIVMQNGDLHFFDGIPTLCCRHKNIDEMLSDPSCCNGIVEALCISLKLTISENCDRFYLLLKSSDRELEYFVTNELDADTWERCCSAFRVSKDEICFWKNVFLQEGIAFDLQALTDNKKLYLSKRLGLPQQLCYYKNFMLHHKQMLKAERDKYLPLYVADIYSRLKCGNDMEQREFISLLNAFREDGWIDDLLAEIKFRIKPDYSKIMKGCLDKKFGFNIACSEACHTQLPRLHEEYLCGHSRHELSLSEQDESLLYFDGKSDYFLALIHRIFPEETMNTEPDVPAEEGSLNSEEVFPISFIATDRPEPSVGKKNRAGTSGRRKPSDKHIKRLGDRAELMVLNSLRAPGSEFEVGAIYSENLASHEGGIGDDSKGFDIEYRRKGDSLYRCLEIKNCSTDGELIISRNEYEASQKEENRERYDLALVRNNKILIWRNAFVNPEKYSLSADEYHVRFDITDEHPNT